MNQHQLLLSASTLLLAAIAPSASAQMAPWVAPTSAQGHFSNWPIGVAVPSPVGLPANPPLVRAPGVNAGAPIAWTETTFGAAELNHPDYSLAKLTENWPSGGPWTPEFGGVSTGGDVTPPVSATGVLDLSGEVWYALNVSFDAYAKGLSNSLIEHQRGGASGTRDISGDVFSYYPDGGVGIHPALANSVRVEYTREQLQMTENLANVDIGMGVISTDKPNRAGPLFPVRNCFYFTLTQRWVNAHSWMSLAGASINASTIYKMAWDGTSWGEPTIAFGHSALFPEVTYPNISIGEVQIDAISVYQFTGHDRVVFSLTPESDAQGYWFDQILVYQRPVGGFGAQCDTTALKAPGSPNGVAVTAKMGAKPRTSMAETGAPDNVDSTCGLDPKRKETGAPPIFPVLGIATDEDPMGDGTLALTSVRTALPDPSNPSAMIDTLHLHVAGLGLGPYQLGVVRFYQQGDEASGEDPVPQQIGTEHFVFGAPYWSNTLNLSGPVSSTVGQTPIRIFATFDGINLLTNPVQVVPLRSSWMLSLRL